MANSAEFTQKIQTQGTRQDALIFHFADDMAKSYWWRAEDGDFGVNGIRITNQLYSGNDITFGNMNSAVLTFDYTNTSGLPLEPTDDWGLSRVYFGVEISEIGSYGELGSIVTELGNIDISYNAGNLVFAHPSKTVRVPLESEPSKVFSIIWDSAYSGIKTIYVYVAAEENKLIRLSIGSEISTLAYIDTADWNAPHFFESSMERKTGFCMDLSKQILVEFYQSSAKRFEYAIMGRFYLKKPSHSSGFFVEVGESYDLMTDADIIFDKVANGSGSETVANFLLHTFDKFRVWSPKSSLQFAVPTAGIPTVRVDAAKTLVNKSLSMRSAIGKVAEAMGVNGYVDGNGVIRFVEASGGRSYTYSAERISSDFQISDVKVAQIDELSIIKKDGSVLTVSAANTTHNAYVSEGNEVVQMNDAQTLLDFLQLVAWGSKTGSVTVLEADPAVKLGDTIIFTVGDKTFSLPAYSIEWLWRGKLSATYSYSSNEVRENVLTEKDYSGGRAWDAIENGFSSGGNLVSTGFSTSGSNANFLTDWVVDGGWRARKIGEKGGKPIFEVFGRVQKNVVVTSDYNGAKWGSFDASYPSSWYECGELLFLNTTVDAPWMLLGVTMDTITGRKITGIVYDLAYSHNPLSATFNFHFIFVGK